MPARVRTVVDPRFAVELARLRRERGLSLRTLAGQVYQGKTLLHELETGQARPSADIAARLDDVLQAGGALAALVQDAPLLDTDRLAYVADHPRRVDVAAIVALDQLLAGQRRMEDSVGSVAVVAPVRAQLDLITALLGDARDALRPRLVSVAAQWAQFAGWLGIATGDPTGARTWLHQALTWSTEADDRDLTATIVSFQGYLAETQGRTGDAIGLSRAARRDERVYAGLRAYCAGQEARTLAAVGAPRAEVLSRLAEAADLATHPSAAPPPWGYWYTPDFFRVQQGIVRQQLGDSDRAVELLAVLRGSSDRSDWHGVLLLYLAGALGQSGDLAGAAGVLDETDAIAAVTRSQRLAVRVSAVRTRLGLSGDR